MTTSESTPVSERDETEQFLTTAKGILEETFGFTSFRAGQEEAIAAVHRGQDCLVILPTGSGKSVCYQVPALILPGVTLVVSPLIALMKDQVDALALRGIPVTFINSSISIEEQWARLDGMRTGAYRLVYVAPERFRVRSFRRALDAVDVSLLAIDEAHCISQWGHDFRPDYRRLKEMRKVLDGVPVIALTATATPEVREDIVRELDMVDPCRVVTGFDRPNLAYRVHRVSGEQAKLDRLRKIVQAAIDDADGEEIPAGIVYAGTRRQTEEVAGLLADLDLCTETPRTEAWCQAYHAGLPPDARRRVQEDFMEGRLPGVVATNAFGMGVDKSDIRWVVHYSLPGSIEAYYQEVGRAGRDGEPARCELLFSEGDRRLQEFFIEGSNPGRPILEAVWHHLWTRGENPIFRSLGDLEDDFDASGLISDKINPMAFRSAVYILERSGALERLDHFENLAAVAPAPDTDWVGNPYPSRAHVRHAVWNGLRELFRRTEDEEASVRLEAWASSLDLPLDSIKTALQQLQREGLIRYLPPFRGRAIRLPDERRSLAEIGVDFRALHERRLRDEERLQQMLSLARARECRRNKILRHFGESLPETPCGICDICRDSGGATGRHVTPRTLTEHETTVVRKLLAGVARARGRCGRGRIIQMLLGSRAQPVTELGFDKLSTWGILKGLTKETLRELLDKLEEQGCVRQVGDRFPIIHLTDRGRRVMTEEESLELALPALGVRGTGTSPRSPSTAEDEGPWDEELFQRLRTLRREIADELGVPAYRIFNDRTLKSMAREKPDSKEGLLAVQGVGETTYERFGERFLGEITRN